MREGTQLSVGTSAGLIEKDTRLIVLQLTISQLALSAQVKFANLFEFFSQLGFRFPGSRLAAPCRFFSFSFSFSAFAFALVFIVKSWDSGWTSSTRGIIDAVDHSLEIGRAHV